MIQSSLLALVWQGKVTINKGSYPFPWEQLGRVGLSGVNHFKWDLVVTTTVEN